MKGFEYEITKHPAETGQCSLDEVPGGQTVILSNILNENGKQG